MGVAIRRLNLILVMLFGLTSLQAQVSLSSVSSAKVLYVKISPSKSSFILGELVVINAEVTNKGETELHIRGATVRSGYLKFLVAGEDRHYKEYRSPVNTPKTPGPTIKPGQSIATQATLFWNRNPARYFANTAGFEKSHIMTDLVFPEAGIYFIKAVLIIPRHDDALRIESEPVQVVIIESRGEDKLVWERVKNNPDIAFFLQMDEPSGSKHDKQKKLLKEIEGIVEEFPNSVLARQLEESLARFRENDRRSKEYIEKLKREQNVQPLK